MSKVIISIPTPLRTYTNSNKRIEIEGDTISDALDDLLNRYPKLEDHLYEEGKLRSFVNIYLNDEDIRYIKENQETKLKSGDQLAIIPSIAGGILL